MKSCECYHERHARVQVEGRFFLRCMRCDRLSAPLGATIVKSEVFRAACDRADGPQIARHDGAVIAALALVLVFIIAWTVGGTR